MVDDQRWRLVLDARQLVKLSRATTVQTVLTANIAMWKMSRTFVSKSRAHCHLASR